MIIKRLHNFLTMKQEINYSRQIDRYLDGVMGSDEKERFEKELKKDDALRAELKLQKKIARAVGEREILSLETQLNTIYHSNYRPIAKLIRFSPGVRRLLHIARVLQQLFC